MAYPGRRAGATVGLAVTLIVALAGCSDDPTSAWGANGHPSASPAEAAPPVNARPGNARVPQPVPGKVMLGAYLNLNGMTTTESLDLRRQQLGRNPRILHWFYEWTDELPSSFMVEPEGAIIMLSWAGTKHESITDGSQDARISRNARNLAKYGKPVFLRFAWEMNGDWSAWSASFNGKNPATYIAAWRHIHDIFARNGATNVGWVWAPNYFSSPVADWNEDHDFYPGDDYVDWIATSGYSNTGQTPDQLFGEFYRKYSGRKPLMIAETGVKDRGGRTAGDWIGALQRWLGSHTGINALVWFDTNTHRKKAGGLDDYRIDREPASLAAYQRIAADPRFHA